MAKNELIHFSGRFPGLKEVDSWEYTFRSNASSVVVLVPAPGWLEARMAEGIMVDPKIYAGLYWAGART